MSSGKLNSLFSQLNMCIVFTVPLQESNPASILLKSKIKHHIGNIKPLYHYFNIRGFCASCFKFPDSFFRVIYNALCVAITTMTETLFHPLIMLHIFSHTSPTQSTQQYAMMQKNAVS